MITRSCGTRGSDHRYKGGRDRRDRRNGREREKKVLSEDTISSRNVPGFYWEKTRDESRAEAPRDLPCATTVPQALISSIISFGDAADRWWVRENERESISGNQPPGLRSAARRRRERKYRETSRSNNPVRPHRPSCHPSSPFLPFSLEREKIKNLNCRSQYATEINFDWCYRTRHRRVRICVIWRENRELMRKSRGITRVYCDNIVWYAKSLIFMTLS